MAPPPPKELYIRYEDPGSDRSLDAALRVTLPAKWQEKKSLKVLQTFVDNYNSKKTTTRLDLGKLKLFGDKSRKEVSLEAPIFQALGDEETVWVREAAFATTEKKEERQMTDYVPRMLAKKDDLETMRAKNQDVLIQRAEEILRLYALPTDENHAVLQVRRVVEERTGVESLLCRCDARVYELTTLVEKPNPLDEYADALARGWTQLGHLLEFQGLVVGPFLPLRGEKGKCAAKIHGRRWLCSIYQTREPLVLGESDDEDDDEGLSAKVLGTVLGKLHRVARASNLANVAAGGATLAPRPWRELVLKKDHVEETLHALRISQKDADAVLDDLPDCWNHCDFRRDSCSKIVAKVTGAQLLLLEREDDDDDDAKSSLPQQDERPPPLEEEEVFHVGGCCDGRLKPRIVDLLPFFVEGDADVEKRLKAMASAFAAYVDASNWVFSVHEIRLAPVAWKLAAQNDADVLADIDERAVDIQIIMRDSVPLRIREGPAPTDPENKSDTSSDYGEAPVSPAPPDEPEPDDFWDRLMWHDKYPTRYDLLRQKLVKKTESKEYEDIFLEHHVKRAPLRANPDPRPLVYSSILQEGEIDSPRPMYLDHIPTVRWRVAAIVILLLRDRDRQENVWDKILPEIPATVHRAVDALFRKKEVEGKLKNEDTSLVVAPDPAIWKSEKLKRGHVAQALSHRTAWRRFLQETTDLDHLIVLEDDADVNWNFKDIFGATLEKLDEIYPAFHEIYDLLYLRVPWDDYDDRPELNVNQFLNLPYPFAKLTAYMVSRRGARKLLDLTTHLDRPLPFLVNDLACRNKVVSFVLRNRGLVGDKGQHPRTLRDPTLVKWWGPKLRSRIDDSPAFLPETTSEGGKPEKPGDDDPTDPTD